MFLQLSYLRPTTIGPYAKYMKALVAEDKTDATSTTCTVSAAVKLVSFVARADETAVRVVTDVVTGAVPLTLVNI